MHILSAGESYLQGQRFASSVKLGLGLLAVLACVLTAVSVHDDAQDSEALARQVDIDKSATLRTLVDNIMDQSWYSLGGMATEVPRAASAADFMARQAQDTLRTAMHYDPASQYLFAKSGAALLVVDRVGRAAQDVQNLVSALPAPPRPEEEHLGVPVKGADDNLLVPMQLATGMARDGQTIVFGALIPLRKLAETQTVLAPSGRSGQAVYLPDGRVLMRGINQDRFAGSMAPESAQIAERARSSKSGEFSATGRFGDPFVGYFERSERHGFIAASGQAREVFAGPWRLRSLAKAALLVVFLALLAVAGRIVLRTLASLSASNTLYRRLFEDVADAVLFTSPTGEVLALNNSALQMTGLSSAAEAIGRSSYDFFPRSIDPATGQPISLGAERTARVLAGERLRYEYSFDAPLTRQHFDCDVHLLAFDTEHGKVILHVARDVTEAKRHVRQQEYLASHDLLTGLPNRYQLIRTLEGHIDATPGAPLALALINLLRFKEINESFGQRAGDTVLEVSAQRLGKALAERGWMLARLGGTDFAALATQDMAATAHDIAVLVQNVVAEPVGAGDATVELHAVVGLTRYPDDALDASQLLRCAEVAAQHAKALGQPCTTYDKDWDVSPPGHDLKLRADLNAAIREGQLRLAFQPKVWLEDKTLAGVEALLRWEHPRRGWISPGEFIPLAESTELIHPLTRWVLGEALDQILVWQRQGLALPVAVNISTNNLQDPDFTEFVKSLLQRKGVPAELLELEITEGALARNPEIVLRRLQDLRAAGVRLALDDFGTGFSSLSYVSQFPFTSIKIDRSFVAALLSSPRDRQVAESTIDLGRKLGLHTIAEGVEDEATASALLALECDVGQGFLFAKPMLPAEFEIWRQSHENAVEAARRQASMLGGKG